MDAIQAIRGRRSMRDYLPGLVERRLIEEVVTDSTYAPWTPLSRPDPWVFTVIEGRKRIEDYGDRALRYAREHRPSLEGYGWADTPGFSVFHGAPAVILISGKIGNP